MAKSEILLDANALIYAARAPAQLSEKARVAIANADRRCISVATLWEISMKCAAGKLRGSGEDYAAAAVGFGAEILPLELADIIAFGQVQDMSHKDPFDRILIATSRRLKLPVVTKDASVRRCLADAIW